tara:strand:+ start:224 stop:403 length:180 start_codon:yes stop_codon:yes gene_type:complete
MKNITAEQYQDDCTKFFAPCDEIAESLINNEGIAGVDYQTLVVLVSSNVELDARVSQYI